MAAPVFQALGAFQAGGAAALTVPWPTHEPGDIAILVVSSSAALGALATPAGFVEIPDSPLAGTALNMNVYWCRATTAAMASPVTATAVNNISGVIVTARGCVPTGDPWDVTSQSAKGTTSTATSITGDTTTLADTLIVYAAARASDFTGSQYSGEADSTVTGLAERADSGTSSGNGGGIGLWTGTKATAGAYGPMTATLLNTSTELYVSIALKAPTLALAITTGANDGYSHSGGTFDATATEAYVGNLGGTTTADSFFRFVNVTIPAGATITAANLDLRAAAFGSTGVSTKIAAEAADNPAAPTTRADHAGRARTTAQVVWDPGAVWANDGRAEISPDISSVIQEVVNRGGWGSGNALIVLWDNDGSPASNYAAAAALEHATFQEPRLAVTYTSATTGTVAVTQADQTSTASALETLTATSAQTQAAQTSSASGSVANPVTGTVAQTQADQTSTATAAESFTGTSANVQADQTSTASGSVGAAPITGTVTVTQADQTSTASGFSVQNLTGTVAVIQADQSSTATAVETFTGTLAETQDDQTSTATATFGFTGTAAVTQDNQTSTASGIAAVTVTGTVAATQQDQFSTATANGGTVTFWVPYPVGYVFNPVAYVSNPAGFVRVGPDSIPPAW